MDMFKDDKGNTSSTRVVWTIGTLTIIGVWAYLCITTGTLVEITMGDATALGMVLGLKVGQKVVEGK